MGSLPNLHELGQNGEPSGYKPGPALGHLCGGFQDTLTTAEKSKILHRYSGHARITKARSNPHDYSNKIVYDDVMLEHMATYSPISTRSRNNLHLHGNVAIKRRDSMSSSIGATSVRRLLAVVRGGPYCSSTGRSGAPIYTKKVLIANLVVYCICHLISSAAFLPFLALQSSVSVWVQSLHSKNIEINTGSFLASETYISAAIFALIAPCVVKRIGASIVTTICYALMAVVYASHLYPLIYVTVPISILLGLVLGLLSGAHISFLMILSHRISGLFQEEEEESKFARRTCVIRRVARAFQGAQDFGLILGSVMTALLVTFTINIRESTYTTDIENGTAISNDCYQNSSQNIQQCMNQSQIVIISSNVFDYSSLLDDIFDHTEEGGRVCGAQVCPISTFGNASVLLDSGFKILPKKSSEILVGVFGGASSAAFILAILCLDRIKMLVYQDPLERSEGIAAIRSVMDSFRDRRLQMAAPLAFFIGLEQAFMYADFSKSYVVCTLGIHRLNLVFLSMGLLQSISACTLSMLLRSVRRYYVVAVGFAFHSCLIMVSLLWKPNEDDPALFYVIAAAWGVCNSIWEMLNFTLLTGQYPDNWEAAFANTAFFKYVGLSGAFLFHSILCNDVKLYMLAFIMVISVVLFAWLEIRLENIRKIKNITRL